MSEAILSQPSFLYSRRLFPTGAPWGFIAAEGQPQRSTAFFLLQRVCCPPSIFAVRPETEEVRVQGALYQLETLVSE